MAINGTKLMVSAAVGVADEAAAWWDQDTGRAEPFRTATDILRLLGTVGGLALQSMTTGYEDIGEAMSLASLPLVMKSVKTVLIKGTAAGGVERREFVPGRTIHSTTMAASSPRSYAWNPKDKNIG